MSQELSLIGSTLGDMSSPGPPSQSSTVDAAGGNPKFETVMIETPNKPAAGGCEKVRPKRSEGSIVVV